MATKINPDEIFDIDQLRTLADNARKRGADCVFHGMVGTDSTG
ncbi:hypothetical protein GCM10019059_45260 [Camelimonas fluminis]|nr:hypothetical protein GCM10019059_45260 [Camelimonas fluminis]